MASEPRPLIWRGTSKADFRTLPQAVQRRAVYTVRYADAVYVIHAFQKRSTKGIATPKVEMDLIQKRLKELISEKERQ